LWKGTIPHRHLGSSEISQACLGDSLVFASARFIAQKTASIQDASARDQRREDLAEQRRVLLPSFGDAVRVRYLP
jgi:hypothetical protein